MNLSISAALIVLNEGDYIHRCLENLSPHVNEIIVVDGGSSDDTIKICKQFEVNLIEKKFEYNFRDQRNFSFKHCRGDWILMIDADEYYDNKFYQNLSSLIHNTTYDAYSITRYNKYFEQIKNPLYRWYKLKKVGWEKQIRLFRSHCYCAGGNIHEYIDGYKNLGEAPGLLIHDKSWSRQKYSNRVYDFLRRNQKPKLDVDQFDSNKREFKK